MGNAACCKDKDDKAQEVLVSSAAASPFGGGPDYYNPDTPKPRPLSLGATVASKGLSKWNEQHSLATWLRILNSGCQATTVEVAVEEVKSFMAMGNLAAYGYLRILSSKNMDLYYGMLLHEPALLLPIAYTPTVGEACQKFGTMPQYPRGCYVCIKDRGRIKAVLQEYAEQMLPKTPAGKYDCQCIVFSDGGRILGLGDLGAFGMGIPLGKLDLYTVCGGFNPNKTIPVIIDAGIDGPEANSAGLDIRGHEMYTGLKQGRAKEKNKAGVMVNSAYYGPNSFIGEFMSAATELFGTGCLLQFEDFNSNDAFPLLAEYRNKFLSYNDDIQGTASVAVAAILGGIKIQKPSAPSLINEARKLRFLFHGAGSANLGGATLLLSEAGVSPSNIYVTNSSGIIWKSADGNSGSYKNDEQKSVAVTGDPGYGKDLVAIIKALKPNVLIGAVGRAPGCFNKDVISAMVDVQPQGWRPIVFALSNPKTQAECSAEQCYDFSSGQAIFGSGTRFPEVEPKKEWKYGNTKPREPGQVNNFFIFPGMSFGAMCCEAKTIPEKFFMTAAEAVAQCLDPHDIQVESVVPHPARIREVAEAVATAVVLEAQKDGLAAKRLGQSKSEVSAALKALMWNPKDLHRREAKKFHRSRSDMGNGASH